MIRTALLSVLLASEGIAQLTLALSPNATFHRTNQDPFATDAVAIPIQSYGVQAGNWLRLRVLGGYDSGNGLDLDYDLVGVFAGNSTLLAASNPQRVQAPATAGTAYLPTSGTAAGNLPMDIAADFWIGRSGYSDEVTIRVPAGATFLFVAAPDSFFGDNSDPNTDFGIELSLAATPAYPGTGGEDLLLASGVNATLDLNPIKTASGAATLTAAIYSPLDVLALQIGAIVVDVAFTGAPPVATFPDTWFGGSALIPFVTLMPSGSPSTSWTFAIPAGHAGTSLWLQGGVLWSGARNTIFVASEAHEIRLL